VSVFAVGFLALELGSRTAAPATASASFGVYATVQASCLASVSSTRLRTDAVQPKSANIEVNCSNSVQYSVSVSAGWGADAIVNAANSDSADTMTITVTY
jgi:spore coat protein U-like protein